MKKTLHISILLAMMLTASCRQTEIPSSGHKDEVPSSDRIYVPGKAIIKVTDELAQVIASEDGCGSIMPGAVMSRTFAHGGRYEERMRKAGLHLWYDVEFDEDLPLTKAGETLLNVGGVEMIEYQPVMARQGVEEVFNDPELRKQWHYFNAGNPITGLLSGCDINVLPAWKRGLVGSDNVIVAVFDGGVDASHEDLKDNMWQGTDENGNVINGYNFVSDTWRINPDEHGTHVAGTIAAVNNNGIGVGGIAGGDAAKGIKGVKIMTCEILDEDKGGDEAAAMVWAANHGAVIAQNSWGYTLEANENLTDTPAYIKAAIDYFNEYAGCDENGEQLPDSPMKGGVVIFAAGNESLPVGYPASYEGCVAVSSIAGDYALAYYSNYGDWIDIAAPGGDANKRQMVLSTVPGNGYGSMQGTSMACPHVSGVAALIVSEFGGPGFTREELLERLLTTADDISLPAAKMGAGMVNASAALARYGENPPHAPAFAGYDEISGTALVLKYLMPEDNEGVECRSAGLYYSTEPFGEITDRQTVLTQSLTGIEPGDTIFFKVENLNFDTKYHFSVQGYDLYENSSQLSENETVTTRDNLPPTVEALDGTEFSFKKYMASKMRFRITDPENELDEVGYESATGADTFAPEGDLYVLTIDAAQIPAGSYTSLITASDLSGRTTECEIRFTVEDNNAPVLAVPMPGVTFSSKTDAKKVNLSEFITDSDGESLTFTAVSSSEAVVKVSVAKDVLTLTSLEFGESLITVTASDAFSETVTATFKVVVRDGKKQMDIYPVPAVDVINIRTAIEQEYDIRIFNSTGREVIREKSLIGVHNVLTLDVTALGPGNYMVRLDGADGKRVESGFVKL